MPAPSVGQGGQGVVTVSPQPGVVTASRGTQISLRGRPIGQLGTIRVTGSRTGHHPGRLRGHSDGRGASYVLRRDLRPGETVTVRTNLPIAGASNGDYRFKVARRPGKPRIGDLILEDVAPGKAHRFRSRPDLVPPVFTVHRRTAAATPGHVILGPKPKRKGSRQAGPLIVDTFGRPIWFKPLKRPLEAYDVRVQEYQGRPAITWWQGTHRQGMGRGEMVIYSDSYRGLKKVRAGNEYPERADLHEFLITPQNTALAVIYSSVIRDARSVGASRRAAVVDSIVQEIDIPTGLVMFEWHSVGQVSLRESFSPPQRSRRNPWDYFHLNSIGVTPDGDLILSARNTWSVHKIDRRTGREEWQLGGKRSSFRMGPGTRFAWQHDARQRADGTVTVFDNSAFPPIRKRSRALSITLDHANRRARLASFRAHPGKRLLAATQGNATDLPNGHLFVGWGSQRYATEYGADGALVWDGRLAIGYETYRAFRQGWIGRPTTPPAVVARRTGERTGARVAVYVSWNGATEVASWEVLAGASPGALRSIATRPRTGFETRIDVPGDHAYVQIHARDAAGQVIGVSPARRVRR